MARIRLKLPAATDPIMLNAQLPPEHEIERPVLEVHQWCKNGDHPEDDTQEVCTPGGDTFLSEGKVVRYYRDPDVAGKSLCPKCNVKMHDHGWIDASEGGHIVCPGDWILKGVKGFFPFIDDQIIRVFYEFVEEEEHAPCAGS